MRSRSTIDLTTEGLHEVNLDGARLAYRVGLDHVDLYSVRVSRVRRGGGLAKSALTKFLAEADRLGVVVRLAASPLDDRTNLHRLISFYERLGFVRTGERANPLGHPMMERRP